MAEPLSASLGILKSSWQAIEFARTAFHARDDARRLYQKVNRLYVLIEKIDSIVREHNEPFDEDIVALVQNALEASNHALDELARRCHKLGDEEDLSLLVRLPTSISYTLSAPTIQKFEQQVQMSMVSVQFALYLLDRVQKQDTDRQFKDLLISIHNAVDKTASFPPSARDRIIEQSDGSLSTPESSEFHKELATYTTAGSHLSPSSSTRTHSVATDDIPASPLELLRSQETRAWGEIRQPSESSSLERRRTKSSDSTALIAAIKDHSLDTFQRLLDEGVNINGTDDKGFTPLMHTISRHGDSCGNCMHCMHKLLELPVDLDASVNGVTALHMAIRYKCLKSAKALLDKGATVDCSTPDTPLLLAVKTNQAVFVELLIVKGADVHVLDEANWSLVHHAVWRKSTEALIALLEQSKTLNFEIDLDARNIVGWTPLMLLAERAQPPQDIRLARILLENEADVNTVDNSDNPALYYALKFHSATPQRNKFVHFLVEEGKANKQLLPTKVLKQAMVRYPALKPRADSAQG